jgi:hypothetical protein
MIINLWALSPYKIIIIIIIKYLRIKILNGLS